MKGNNNSIVNELVKNVREMKGFVREQKEINRELKEISLRLDKRANVSEKRFQAFSEESEKRFRTFYHLIVNLQKR